MFITLKDIAAAVNGRLDKSEFAEMVVTSVTTDSRSVPEGSLFIPLTGGKFDGHDYIMEAFEKGASAALSACESAPGRPIINVSDTKKSLQTLAEWYLSQQSVIKIAITGSSGKTITKDMIASVLSQHGKTYKTQGNLNNDIGVPLTILSMPKDTKYIVMEMGMNHLGEISVLSRLAKPDIAVITNIGVAHIENLGSQESILQAKLEILEGLSPNGTAIFNGDDKFLRSAGVTCVYYGLDVINDISAIDVIQQGLQGSSFTYKDNKFEVPVPGKHMVYNALAAIAVAEQMGLTIPQMQAGIANFQPSGQRLKIIENGGITIIDDTYNANPESVAAALHVLAEAKGRKICVLGDMLELGEHACSMHYTTGELAVKLGIDVIICIGELSRNTYYGAEDNAHAIHFIDVIQAIEHIQQIAQANDTILIKASRSMKFEEIVKKLL